ncbi:MAG: glycosyltransferase family 2 protein, partial [Clostridiales bacterium]|nr:glycosyltransferase family 2 protein [Clostridiales bacterium]
MYRFFSFILCGGDAGAIGKTLESLRNAGIMEYALLFSKKKYQLPPETLARISEIACESTNGRLFMGIEGQLTLAELDALLKNGGADVILFLSEGERVSTRYSWYIERFFAENHDACAVAYGPALEKPGAALPPACEDLPPGGLSAADENRPEGLRGAAIWADDARELGLDVWLGGGAFADLLKRAVDRKGCYGRLSQAMIYGAARSNEAPHVGFKTPSWLVSCIIPVYNAEMYLTEAIDSVIKQTLGFEKHVQLILVNDGSTDGSGEICREVREQYPENVVYLERENKGSAAARNAGLDAAAGEYIAFLDADDRLDAKFLESNIRFCADKNVEFVATPIKPMKALNKLDPLLHYQFGKSV